MTPSPDPDIPAILAHLTATPFGAEVVESSATLFFFAPPEAGQASDHLRPFVTLVGNDAHDGASNLNRPDVFRLNIGVRRETFRHLFADGAAHDFTALDTFMPHPVCAGSNWMCVLNPSAVTFETLKPLLEEAFLLTRERLTRKQKQG